VVGMIEQEQVLQCCRSDRTWNADR